MTQSNSVVLSELLAPATINLSLRGKDREQVFEELVSQIPELVDQPEARNTLLHALHEREQLHSTGIGDGVALPHARNALVGLVDHPVIIFGRSAQGVNFGAIDGAPSKLFFLLVAPTVTDHLAMLARLSRLLRDPRLRQELLAADSPKKALALIKDAEAAL